MNALKTELAKAQQLEKEGHLAKAADCYHQIGLGYIQTDESAEAIISFQKAVSLDPTNPLMHNHLANAYRRNQQWAQALEHYKKAIALAPDYAEAHNNLAGLYALQNAYQPALQHYRAAIHAQPDFMIAHFNLGLLLIKHKELQAALTQFNNVLALYPEHQEARFYIGVLQLEANQLLDAKAAFQQVLEHNPNHVEALTNLGVIALKEDNNQLAIDTFSKALALDNTHLEARNNLAATFIHFDRFENALMHYDVLLKQDPTNCEYLYNSGVAQMALGHLNEAIVHFEQLLSIDSQHFAALNNLAAIYNRLEDKPTAEKLLKRAVAANPDDKASQHMLNALSHSQNTAATCPEYAENLFNNYALYYDDHVRNQLHYTLPNHILRLLEALDRAHFDDTLDLGCGTGLTGQMLRDLSTHLEGVDIAKKMVAQAKEKSIYDALYESEALAFLQTTTRLYDLIVAADVLPYFGELEALFSAVKKHLKPKGLFIFTTEISRIKPWQLNDNARFAHHSDYVQELARRHFLDIALQKEVIARFQNQQPVPVYLLALSL